MSLRFFFSFLLQRSSISFQYVTVVIRVGLMQNRHFFSLLSGVDIWINRANFIRHKIANSTVNDNSEHKHKLHNNNKIQFSAISSRFNRQKWEWTDSNNINWHNYMNKFRTIARLFFLFCFVFTAATQRTSVCFLNEKHRKYATNKMHSTYTTICARKTSNINVERPLPHCYQQNEFFFFHFDHFNCLFCLTIYNLTMVYVEMSANQMPTTLKTVKMKKVNIEGRELIVKQPMAPSIKCP